ENHHRSLRGIRRKDHGRIHHDLSPRHPRAPSGGTDHPGQHSLYPRTHAGRFAGSGTGGPGDPEDPRHRRLSKHKKTPPRGSPVSAPDTIFLEKERPTAVLPAKISLGIPDTFRTERRPFPSPC